MKTVYVSSTFSDLEEHRKSVQQQLRTMELVAVAMEDYSAGDKRPLDKCLDDVRRCDYYVGIFAWRYGFIPDGHTQAITELEYREAEKLGKPRFIFLADDNAPWPRSCMDEVTGEGDGGSKIGGLREELRRQRLVSFFTGPEDLAKNVATAIHNWEHEERQKEETGKRALNPTKEQVLRLQRQLEEAIAQQAAEEQSRQKLTRERVVGPVESTVVQHFKDRVSELRSLREQLADANLRLLLVCGRGGMGKTALITKLVHDIKSDFTLRLDTATSEVESIVYVALRQSEFRSPDKIVDLICSTLEPEAREELRAKWQEKSSLTDKLEFLFRRTLGSRRCLIVLDNFEDVLDDENRIHDEFADLREFVESCLKYDHGARLVATSRRTLVLSSPELEGRVGGRRVELPLDEGLPEEEAVALLRDLDGDGRLGIKEASAATLAEIARRCHGIPRTLVTLVGTLCTRRTLTLARLIEDDAALTKLIENPARELYGGLSAEERLVVQTLAVYGRPVPAVAVRYLLPGLEVDEILDALVRNYVAAYDRDCFSLHPFDEHYAYQQIPDSDGDFSRPALHGRAAQFFHEASKSRAEWKTIDDLDPQLQEFHHLVRAGLHDRAAFLLTAIGGDYLSLWGYDALLIELRLQLVGKLDDPGREMVNLNFLGVAYCDQGRPQRAIECCQRGLAIAREIDDSAYAGVCAGNLGKAYHILGHVETAIECYEEDLVVTQKTWDRVGEGVRLSSLGAAYYDVGKMERSHEFLAKALAIARELGDERGAVLRLLRLAKTFLALGHRQDAVERLEEAIELAREIAFPRGEVTALAVLARAEDRCELPDTTERYEVALSTAREIGDKVALGDLLIALASGYHRFGDLAKSRTLYEEAATLDVPLANCDCTVKLGILAVEAGSAEQAGECLARGIALCRALLQKTPTFWTPLYLLALAQLGSSQAGPAMASYQRAQEVCSTNGVLQEALRDLSLLERISPPLSGSAEARAMLEKRLRAD